MSFGTSEQDTYLRCGSTDPLPLSFSNAATSAAASQTITFTDTGTSWDGYDSSTHSCSTNPIYRSFVQVLVAPPTPVLNSISASGKTISGSTFDNNGTASEAFTFNISGVVSGAKRSACTSTTARRRWSPARLPARQSR